MSNNRKNSEQRVSSDKFSSPLFALLRVRLAANSFIVCPSNILDALNIAQLGSLQPVLKSLPLILRKTVKTVIISVACKMMVNETIIRKDISDLAKGFYLIQLSKLSGEKLSVNRLIVQ